MIQTKNGTSTQNTQLTINTKNMRDLMKGIILANINTDNTEMLRAQSGCESVLQSES